MSSLQGRKVDEGGRPPSLQRHPLEGSNVLQRQLMLWMWPLLRLGNRRPLVADDVWPVPRWMGSRSVGPRLWHLLAAGGIKSLTKAVMTFGSSYLIRILWVGAQGAFLVQLPPLLLGQVLDTLVKGEDARQEPYELNGWLWAILIFLCASAATFNVSTIHRLHAGLGVEEPWVFSGTIRDNVLGTVSDEEVASGDLQEQDARLWQALQFAHLEAEVRDTFPGGPSCEIGFRGVNLSGGQKARLALARALAMPGDPPLVFDDVLSSLDLPTAEVIAQKTFLGHLSGRTRVVALNSHYDALLPHADVIILVESGTAIAFRSRREFSKTDFAQRLASGQQQEASNGAAGEEASHQGSPSSSSLARCPDWIAAGLPEDLGTKDLDGAQPSRLDVHEGSSPSRCAGKLYEPEVKGRGPLNPQTYLTYFGLGHGSAERCSSWARLLLVVVLIPLPDVCRIFGEFFLSQGLRPEKAWGWWPKGGDWLPVFAGIVFLTFVLALIRAMVFMVLARHSSQRIHDRVLDSLCDAPVHRFFDTVPPGRLMNLCAKDLDAVDTLLPYQALEFLQDVAMLGSTLLMSIVVFPLTLVVALPVTYLVIRIRRLYVLSAQELMRMEASSRSPVLTLLTETVEGLPVLQAQKSEDKMYERFLKLVDTNWSFFMHSWFLMPWLALNLELMVALFVFAACASALLLRGMVDDNAMVVALTGSMALLTKVQITCRQSAEVEKLFTAVERLAQLLRDIPAEEGLGQAGADILPAPAQCQESRATTGEVRFDSVSLRYRSGLPLVLSGLTFRVRAGTSVGLIGTSGCGKSSTIRALLRLAEVEGGQISLDGVDIRSVPIRILRRQVAAIPQEPLLLSGTLMSNLLPDVQQDQLQQPVRESDCWKVLDLVGLGEAVRRWEKGLDTELAVGEEGALSLGQRQLLGLGRALLRRDAKVLCVDEATAHVDGSTDAALQRALLARDGGAGGRTRLTVAHRLWTLRHCDEVYAPSTGKLRLPPPRPLPHKPDQDLQRLPTAS